MVASRLLTKSVNLTRPEVPEKVRELLLDGVTQIAISHTDDGHRCNVSWPVLYSTRAPEPRRA